MVDLKMALTVVLLKVFFSQTQGLLRDFQVD